MPGRRVTTLLPAAFDGRSKRWGESAGANFARLTECLAKNVDEMAQSVANMRATVATVAKIADQTSRQSKAVATAAEETTASVRTVAAAAEEMQASIAEITRQVDGSAKIAAEATGEMKRSNAAMQSRRRRRRPSVRWWS